MIIKNVEHFTVKLIETGSERGKVRYEELSGKFLDRICNIRRGWGKEQWIEKIKEVPFQFKLFQVSLTLRHRLNWRQNVKYSLLNNNDVAINDNYVVDNNNEVSVIDCRSILLRRMLRIETHLPPHNSLILDHNNASMLVFYHFYILGWNIMFFLLALLFSIISLFCFSFRIFSSPLQTIFISNIMFQSTASCSD